MTEKIRCALYSIMGIALGIVLLLPGGHVQASEKKTIYNSSYVSFSPDGKAWTTCAGDRNYKWYDENETTTVYTGIKSSLEALQEGEHYYRFSRRGEVPIGAWQVVLRGAQCIHNAYGAPPGLFRLEAVVCGLRRTDRMVEYLYEQGSGGDDTVYGSGQRRKPCDLLLFVPVL